jgi:MoaA/NifB/PqqE/SkfB family radical SAM enzyme
MVALTEIARRQIGTFSGRLRSLPILALSVHSACNCRCVMCDIWKANAEKREISVGELERHIAGIRRLRVKRVMLTGGEPLLHRNLFALCQRLRAESVSITLVTTGLLVGQYAEEIARTVGELVVSIDGPPEVHDEIRRTRGGFDRIARGLQVLAACARRPHVIARSVVQRANHAVLAETIQAVRGLAVDRLSFLSADVASSAFNRPEPWDAPRRSEIAVTRDLLPALSDAIRKVEVACPDLLTRGFVAGGSASLHRIHEYYSALAGLSRFPSVRCNAPWVSAVLEPGGQLRPCFFHPPYQSVESEPFDAALNAPMACEFRRGLDVATDPTCQRCVCSLSLPPWANA